MFSDIESHWASQCILALARRGLISGYPNGMFRPRATVNRAEFAALMRKVFPELLPKAEVVRFRDVTEQYWGHGAIVWAAQRGLFSGYENGTFRPRISISRAQTLVVLMAGVQRTQGVDTALIPPEAASDRDPGLGSVVGSVVEQFHDASSIPDYAQAAIASALNQQLLETRPEPRSFYPNRAMTRGEVAALLCRILSIPASELTVQYPALVAAQDRAHVFQTFLQQEAGFNEAQLAFLDKGIRRSPYRKGIGQYALRLQLPDAVIAPLPNAAVYPDTGSLFFVNEGGLDFLPDDIVSGCVCLAATERGKHQGRWLGREALSDRQLWSATKFLPLLNVAARANAVSATTDIDRCRVRAVGSTGRNSGYPFHDLAEGIMTYDNRIATSNSLAVTFKNFQSPAQLEKWTQQMTGNQSLSFQGRYGEVPFIASPELYDPDTGRALLKAPRSVSHRGQNLISTYNLTRLITMAGWHWRLPAQSRIPNLQTHSLESIIRAMGTDTARYVDVALQTLGLDHMAINPVIISKSGFGRSDQRDRTELTYCALAQFSLPRQIAQQAAQQDISNAASRAPHHPGAPDPTAAYQSYSIGFTLVAAQNVGDAHEEARYVDALMAAAVTEIIRRAVLNHL